MALTADDLDRARDYVGSSPDDATLQAYAADLADSWVRVALRVLRRRAADLASAQSQSLTIPGVIGVSTSQSSKLTDLRRLIGELEALLADETGEQPAGARVARVHRTTARGGAIYPTAGTLRPGG
jgi:hypothetical protein